MSVLDYKLKYGMKFSFYKQTHTHTSADILGNAYTLTHAWSGKKLDSHKLCWKSIVQLIFLCFDSWSVDDQINYKHETDWIHFPKGFILNDFQFPCKFLLNF